MKKVLKLLLLFSFVTMGVFHISQQNAYAVAEDISAEDVGTVSAVKFTDAKNFHLGGMALDGEGKIWTWGYNIHSKLGLGPTGNGKQISSYAGGMVRIPFFVNNNINVVSIETSYHTNYAIDDQGQVYSWGNGAYYAIGNGILRDQSSPINISVLDGSSLKGKKIIKIVASDEAGNSAIALDEEGEVHFWGKRQFNLSLDQPINGGLPVMLKQVKEMVGVIKDISIGSGHVLVLSNDGKLFGWGDNGQNQLGPDNFGRTVNKIQWFEDNGIVITQISAKGHISLVLGDNHQVYQFGKNEALQKISPPEPVQFNLTDSNYIPIPTTIIAGKVVNYFIDHHGRIWSWGKNTYHGFMIEGGYIDTLNITRKAAQLAPLTMGDGDTQITGNDVKAPVFKEERVRPAALTNFKALGMWANINNKHPSIYDKKYMRTVGEIDRNHNKVFPVDKNGRRLVYLVRKKDNKYSGQFLVANDGYKGDWYEELDEDITKPNKWPEGLTKTFSSPEVKESEKGWIGLSTDLAHFDYTGDNLKEVPKIEKIHIHHSATVVLDTGGNLYKSAYDGSGAIAWGWDIEPAYDTGYSTTNPQDGLYDLYNYELTFMRGAPRIIPGDIVINNTKDKHYLSTKKTDKIGMKIDIGMAYHDEQLNIKVEPELRQVKRIIMPYDPTSADFNNLAPTYDDFMTAYNDAQNRGYDTLDIARKNDWEGIKHEVGAPPVDHLIDESTEIKDNSVVWIMLQTHNYSNSPVTIKRLEFDNFYTESLIKSKGAMLDNPKEETYAPLPDNVVKVTKDNNKDVYGFPLDKHGHIIAEPTFGYDEVSIRRIDDSRLDELGTRPKFSQRYLWPTTQSEEKTYLLDGQDSIKNGPGDIAQKEGSLPVDETFTHTFYYEENPHIRYNLHYMAVTDEGEIISPEEFDIPSEIRMLKDEELTRKAPKLKKNEDVIPITYQVVYSKPPKTVDLNKFKELTPDKEAIFRVPVIDDITDATLIYLYEEEEKEVVLNVRQVILKDNNIALPEVGYASYRGANKDWSQQEGLNQVKMPSQILKDPVTYRPIPLIINKKVDRFSLEAVIPQYYKYIGFKQSNKDGNYDTTSIEKDKIIPVDYSDKSKEKWVTIYIEPLTDQPSNYTWQSIVNSFGEVLVK